MLKLLHSGILNDFNSSKYSWLHFDKLTVPYMKGDKFFVVS